MPRETQPAQNSVQSLIDHAQQEFEQVQKQLKEVEMLIQQSTTEVEKLTQANARLATQVRQMEANIDTYPRDDIRELYHAAQEAQMRLFMMRGQIEQLQARREHLSQYAGLLRKILEIGAFGPISQPDAGKSSSAASILRIIDAQEQERKRLARHMHDGPAQSLTNLILQAEICERLFDTDPSRARTELAALRNAVNVTFQKVREFIFELSPMMLDDLGLVPTLRRYIQDFGEKTGLSIQLNTMGAERRLPSQIEILLFRSIQELLGNIHRHAQASRAQIMLEFAQDAVDVMVEDDGIGFLPDDVLSEDAPTNKLGLRTLRQQMTMLGGTFDVDSSPTKGTRISIHLPIS